MAWSEWDISCMRLALELATRGEGAVEPNPLVGCVLAREGKVIAQGWHGKFGGPHAEVVALANSPTGAARGCTAYTTLEPCSHVGKTPPCAEALIQAGVARVVVAQGDPFPLVNGGGVARLRAAGIAVEIGCLEQAAAELNAPYLTLLNQKRPWVIAKWAMSLDGKIATHTGHSQWISGEASRRMVHALRGRVDAILIGSGTAKHDDPLLTARPPGPRLATRIVFDSRAELASESQLVRTLALAPLLIAAGPQAEPTHLARLQAAGCEIWQSQADSPGERCRELLAELGRRRLTNLLVEGGGTLLGTLFDEQLIDEVQIFIAPKFIGGAAAISPLAGIGLSEVGRESSFVSSHWEQLGEDLHFHGRLRTR